MTDRIARLRAAFEREPLVNSHRDAIEVNFEGDILVISGEVDRIGAKRIAAHIAAGFATQVEDRLRVRPAEPRDDGAIKDALALMLRTESAFHHCRIDLRWHGQHETMLDAPDPDSCRLDITIENGCLTLQGLVNSLSHKRLAETLAWWSPGAAAVDNRLAVIPDEVDTDDEITDAVNLVLEKDPLVHSDRIRVGTRDAVVTLEGLVAEASEREMAENDAWYLGGVREVLNRIEVRSGIVGG